MWVTFWPLQKKNPHLRFDHYKKNNSFSFWSLQKKTHSRFGHYKQNSFVFRSLQKKTHLRFGHWKKKKLIYVLVITRKKNSFAFWSLQKKKLVYGGIVSVLGYYNYY